MVTSLALMAPCTLTGLCAIRVTLPLPLVMAWLSTPPVLSMRTSPVPVARLPSTSTSGALVVVKAMPPAPLLVALKLLRRLPASFSTVPLCDCVARLLATTAPLWLMAPVLAVKLMACLLYTSPSPRD